MSQTFEGTLRESKGSSDESLYVYFFPLLRRVLRQADLRSRVRGLNMLSSEAVSAHSAPVGIAKSRRVWSWFSRKWSVMVFDKPDFHGESPKIRSPDLLQFPALACGKRRLVELLSQI